MPAFPRRARRDDATLVRRANNEPAAPGDWQPHGGVLHRRRRLYLEQRARAEFVARGREQIRDWVFGTEMAGLEQWTYPYVRTLIDDQKGEVRRHLAPGRAGEGPRRQALRDRRHRRLLVPLRG